MVGSESKAACAVQIARCANRRALDDGARTTESGRSQSLGGGRPSGLRSYARARAVCMRGNSNKRDFNMQRARSSLIIVVFGAPDKSGLERAVAAAAAAQRSSRAHR